MELFLSFLFSKTIMKKHYYNAITLNINNAINLNNKSILSTIERNYFIYLFIFFLYKYVFTTTIKTYHCYYLFEFYLVVFVVS